MLAKGDHASARNTFVTAVTMPAFVSGIFRVRFYVFVLGALVAGIGFIGLYVGLSYFYGAEVARLVGDVGAKVLLSVLAAVAAGLTIKVGIAKWRTARQERPAQT